MSGESPASAPAIVPVAGVVVGPAVVAGVVVAGEDTWDGMDPPEEVEVGALTGLLEAPSYTRPPVYRGIGVPEVLTSGDHGAVARYRHEESLRRTAANRPDLLDPEHPG